MERKLNCLGATIAITTPDSVEAFDMAANRVGAALEAATLYVLYHKTLGDVREDIVEAAEKAFNFPRLEIDTGKKRKSDGSAIMVDESAEEYYKRLCADKGWDREEPPTEWTSFVATIPVTFDPSTKVRERKAKTLAKIYIEATDQIWSRGSQAKAAAALGVTLTGDDAKDKELIGWALKAREDAKRRAAEANLKNEF